MLKSYAKGAFSAIKIFQYKKNIISNRKITEKAFFGVILIDYVQKNKKSKITENVNFWSH